MWGWITGNDHPTEGEGAKPSASASVIEGLVSPSTDLDFQMEGAKLLEEVRKYGEQENTAEVGWTPVSHSTANVDLYERMVPKLEGTSLTFMKCVGDVQGASPQDILGFTLEHDLAKRKEFDPDISLLEVVKTITPTIQVTRTHFVAPYPVYPREFVDMRAWVEGDDRIIFGAQSINFSEAPFSTEHVRGVSFNGIIMEKIANSEATRITFMGYVDPQGWVPHAIIAAFRTKIAERIDVMRQMVAKGAKEVKK